MAEIQRATQQSRKRSHCAQTWAVQAGELFLLQRGWEGFRWEVQILVLCCVMFHWPEHRCISKWEQMPKDAKQYLKWKRREKESWRWRWPTPNRSDAATDRLDALDGTGAGENTQTSTTGRLSWITTELGCGSNSDRAASSGSAGSVSGLTCAQVNTWLRSSSWSEVGVVAVAWFQVQG